MPKAQRRAPRKIPQARLMASRLVEQHGTMALFHASERVAFFHSLGDYDSVARWARVAAAVSKLQRSSEKRSKRGTVEILPPALPPSAPEAPPPSPDAATELPNLPVLDLSPCRDEAMALPNLPVLDLSPEATLSSEPAQSGVFAKYLRAILFWRAGARAHSGGSPV